ncbi:MAG: hypothetical protein EHM70_14315 [Chloroflexota bacterium]|nr:MAG: hypothetical protein EHM70_14315 [Chloroflexota bacterium]
MDINSFINPPGFTTGILVVTLAWLGYLSWYDIQKGERPPHAAWVLAPFVIAVAIRLLAGGYSLAALATAALVVSNRKQMAERCRRLASGIGIAIVILSTLASLPSHPTGTLAMLAFWLSWELAPEFIGGADALVSMTLFLLWPQYGLLIAILAGHLLATLGLLAWDGYRKRKLTLMHRIPGMPVLAVSVVFFALLYLR